MTVTLDESQVAIRDLAADLFTRRVDPARLEKVEETADRFDTDLWSALADAGLLGVTVAEADGGLGLGGLELALVLEQLGRSVAPVPLVATSLAAWCVGVHGSAEQRESLLPRIVSGAAVIAVAPAVSTVSVEVADDRLTGTAVGVPWAHVASHVLMVAGDRVWLVEPTATGVTTTRGETTAREGALDLVLDGVTAKQVGGSETAAWLRHRWMVLLAAVQAGVTDAALRMTATYTSQRDQFGKPLSTFQAVALKAADAYLDTTVIRASALQAMWALDALPDPELQVLTAAWWAAEGGQHAVHLTQHLHGGMGADVTYPVHRYFLWGKQIELLLGGASSLLAQLGDALDGRPDAGDAITVD